MAWHIFISVCFFKDLSKSYFKRFSFSQPPLQMRTMPRAITLVKREVWWLLDLTKGPPILFLSRSLLWVVVILCSQSAVISLKSGIRFKYWIPLSFGYSYFNKYLVIKRKVPNLGVNRLRNPPVKASWGQQISIAARTIKFRLQINFSNRPQIDTIPSNARMKPLFENAPDGNISIGKYWQLCRAVIYGVWFFLEFIALPHQRQSVFSGIEILSGIGYRGMHSPISTQKSFIINKLSWGGWVKLSTCWFYR